MQMDIVFVILIFFELPYTKNWFDHVAEKVTTNKNTKVLWYFTIQTDGVIEARNTRYSSDRYRDRLYVGDL